MTQVKLRVLDAAVNRVALQVDGTRRSAEGRYAHAGNDPRVAVRRRRRPGALPRQDGLARAGRE